MNVLISACLLGVNCRYSGDGTFIKEGNGVLADLLEKNGIVVVGESEINRLLAIDL